MNFANAKRRAAAGFTLIEMLIVIGIITVLVAASIVSYSRVTASAEKARCSELVKNVHSALVLLYNDNSGAWPRALINGQVAGRLDERACAALTKYMPLDLTGYDRFRIVSPWAQQAIKQLGSRATLTSRVPTGGTVEDHILRYAIDTEGNGVIRDAVVGGSSVSLRGTAMVWCCGKDGILEEYEKGLKKDDVYSWTRGETQKVQ